MLSNEDETWTLQLRFPDELQAFCRFISYVWKKQSQTTIESLAFRPIPQVGKTAPEDLVTYLMLRIEVGLPNAV